MDSLQSMPGLFFGDIVTLKTRGDAQYVFVGTYENAAAVAYPLCVFVQIFHIRSLIGDGYNHAPSDQDILSFFESMPLDDVFNRIESPLPVILAVDNYFSALTEEDRANNVISGALFKAYYFFVGAK